MNSEIASLEADLKDFRIQLETVQSGLQSDPENVELKALEAELQEAISASEALIAELQPAAPPPPPKEPTPPPAEKPKWSIENHPAFQPGYKKPGTPQSPVEPPAPVAYKVNDNVLARWLSGDKSYYPARITSITGSSADPVYYVTFKSYGNTEALRKGDIKPVFADSRKRKADGTPVTSSNTPAAASTTSNAGVISAAASINPALASQVKKDAKAPLGDDARPAKPKKVKASKELEKNKNKWQDFTSSKGTKGTKSGKKESMFKTGDGVGARIGFMGSGQAMRKDPTRSRHVYQPTDEDNY